MGVVAKRSLGTPWLLCEDDLKEKHRTEVTEVTEEGNGGGGQEIVGDAVASGRGRPQGKASHRGHRGHGGRKWGWWPRDRWGHRGFCARTTSRESIAQRSQRPRRGNGGGGKRSLGTPWLRCGNDLKESIARRSRRSRRGKTGDVTSGQEGVGILQLLQLLQLLHS